MGTLNRKIALGIFAVLVIAAPLLFGASDRLFQAALTFVLGLGFLALPPVLPSGGRGWKWAIFIFVAAVAAKEFLPQSWFGQENWRMILTRDYQVQVSPLHNPEPARAVDDLLAVVVAGAFFLWARTLAADARLRVALAWWLAISGGIFAVVCLACGTRSDSMIYGWRYTPGWMGYGAFPNRNHTAALLAMAALIGSGCTVRAARRKNYAQLLGGMLVVAVIFVAMVQSKSRGGLIGFSFGLFVFGVLTVVKVRTPAALISVLATCFISAGLLFGFGGKLLARFDSAADGNIPNNIRWEIWQNSIAMWKEAPLFGFGLDSFAQLFPFYQTIRIDDAYVLHPESSWLLWLVELGAVPVGLLVLALIVFLSKNVRAMFTSESGFFLRAGALAGVAALLCHSLYDVPAHRWATAGFGLALLAIACPPCGREAKKPLERKATAGVPFVIAAFWLLPIFTKMPVWSPTALDQLLAASVDTPTKISTGELEKTIPYFPLTSDLYQGLGLRALMEGAQARAWREFRIANKLNPISWQLPATQAWLAGQYSPGMAVYLWTLAIERSGHRQPEIFDMAFRQTTALVPEKAWSDYAVTHPEFLTIYSTIVFNPQAGQAAYDQWWKTRALTAELTTFEIAYFYKCAAKYGTRAQLDTWTKSHPELEANDFKEWAQLLHLWNDDAAAWHWLARSVKDPEFPAASREQRLDVLEAAWFANPADTLNAQALAASYAQRGQLESSQRIIYTVAGRENPPAWFVQKAAWLYAAAGDYAQAVHAVLRDPRG